MKKNYKAEIESLSNEAHKLSDLALKGSSHRDPACRAIWHLAQDFPGRKELKKAQKIIGFLRLNQWSAATKYVRDQNARGILVLD